MNRYICRSLTSQITHGNRRVQGDHVFTRWRDRKHFDVSFPTKNPHRTRPSWCFTHRQPDTWPRNSTCHAQTVDADCHRLRRRYSEDSEERFARTLTGTTTSASMSPNTSSQIHLKTLKAHLIAKLNLHLLRPAERALRWSVRKPSSWKRPFQPNLNTQLNASTFYLLVFIFFSVLLFYCVGGQAPRPWAATLNVYTPTPYSKAFLTNLPFQRAARYVLCVVGALELVSPLTFCENKKKGGGGGDKVRERTSGESPQFTQLRTSWASSINTNAGFLRRQVRWLPKVSRRTHSGSSNVRSLSPAGKPDTDWLSSACQCERIS